MNRKFIFVRFMFFVGLLVTQAKVFSQTDFYSNSNFNDLNKDFFSRYFDRADRATTPYEWIETARKSLDEAKIIWAEMIPEINRDPSVLVDIKTEFARLTEDELERRFTKWLLNRFMAEGMENAIQEMQKNRTDADKLYLYKTNDNGDILYDDITGNPLLIRPEDGTEHFADDLTRWRTIVSDSIQDSIQNYQDVLSAAYPELLLYIDEERRDEFGKKLSEMSDVAVESMRNEFAAVLAREERHFTARRIGDIYSLRKKSEGESALSIGSHLVEEAEKITSEGLAVLAAKIEAADAGTGDLALAGSDWLAQYREQFERGIRAWEDAEERFLIRRIEWEQGAVRNYSEGEEAWNNAFKQFETARYEWEAKTAALFTEGESLFVAASASLENEIAEAKAEFLRNSRLGIQSGTEQARAWADMYLTSAAAINDADENLDFWLNRYQNEARRERPNITLPSSGDSVDFDKWLADESFFWKNRKNENINSILSELGNWSRLRSLYHEKAVDSITYLKNELSKLSGSGSLTDILDPAAADERFFPDEYQTELLRAQAVVDYWARRISIANAVSEYAGDLTAGRITESEGIRAWENAKAEYDDALTLYETSALQMKDAGSELTDIHDRMSQAIETMEKSERELESLNIELNKILTAYGIKRENYLIDELNQKKNALAEIAKILDDFEDGSVNIRYLNAVFEYGAAEESRLVTELLKEFVSGGVYFKESLAELSRNAASAIARLESGGSSDALEQYLLGAEKTKAVREEQNRLMLINLLNAGSLENWYRGASGYSFPQNFSGAEINLNEFEQYLADEWEGANYRLFKARVLLELDALDICLGAVPVNTDAAFLANYSLLKRNELVDAKDALNRILSEVTRNDGNRSDEWVAALTALAAENEYAHTFLTLGSFFERQSDFLVADLFLGSELDSFEKAAGIMTAYNLLKSVSPATKNHLEKEKINSLYGLFDEYGINDNTLAPKDVDAFIEALLRENGDSLENTSRFLMTLDDVISVLPKWINEESNVFKNLFVDVYASRCVDYELTISSAEIREQIAGLEAACKQMVNNGQYTGYDEWNAVAQMRQEITLLKYRCIVTERIEETRQLAAADDNSLNALLRSAALLNSAYMIYRQRDFGLSENVDFLVNVYSENPVSEWNEELVRIPDLVYLENRDFYKNELSKNILYEQFLVSEIRSLEYMLDPGNRGAAYFEAEIARLEAKIETVQGMLDSQSSEYRDLTEEYSDNSRAYSDFYSTSKTLFLSAEEKRLEYEKHDAIKRWAETAYLDIGKTLDELEYCREKKERADSALDVLKGLYAQGDEERAYANSEYNLLCDEYRKNQVSLFTSLQALNTLNDTLRGDLNSYREHYEAYQNQLALLGGFMFEDNWYLGNDPDYKKLREQITVRDGKLVFAMTGGFQKRKKTDAEELALQNYFERNIDFGGQKISAFEKALMEFSSRLKTQNTGQLFRSWGITGNLILSKLNNDTSSYISNRMQDGLLGYNTLPDVTKNDIEFFMILSMANGLNKNSMFFKKMNSLIEVADKFYAARYNLEDKQGWANLWVIGFLWSNARDEAQYEFDKIAPTYHQFENDMINIVNDITANLALLGEKRDRFLSISEKINTLTGKNEAVSWERVRKALTQSGISKDDLRIIEDSWLLHLKEETNSFGSIGEALEQLVRINKAEIKTNQTAINALWNSDNEVRRTDEYSYRSRFEAYLAGALPLDILRESAEKAYGADTASIKNHILTQGKILSETIDAFFDGGMTVNSEYKNLVYEYVNLLGGAYKVQYDSLLAVRESEWNIQRNDIEEKYRIWISDSGRIVESGTEDWKNNLKKLEDSYALWQRTFENEYRRTGEAWTAAYLESLNEKESWMETATMAANEVSSKALLALIGSDAESMSRAMDSRDPILMREPAGKESADKALADLIFGTGISRLEEMFGSINGITGSLNLAARGGLGTGSDVNYGIIQNEAAQFVKKTNESLAAREMFRAAVSLRDMAEESIKMLADNIRQSNDSVRVQMDEMFIVSGQFKRSGLDYSRDVLVHSTFFDSVITESVLIEGYRDFVLAPVHLNTDLSDGSISGLDSIAIQFLMEDLLAELKQITVDVFGTQEDDGESSPKGKFGLHLGNPPEIKDESDINIDNGKDGIFKHRGDGEFGRLMTEFQFWYFKEQKGLALLSTAPWDRPLWDSRGSFFEAPSLRTSVSVGVGIVATVATAGVGGIGGIAATVALNSATDLVFGIADVAGGYKSWAEAGVEFGKSLLKNTISSAAGSLTGALGEKISSVAAKSLGGQVAASLGRGIINATKDITVGTITSAISSTTYDDVAGWGFSHDRFNAGVMDSLKGSLVSATSTITGGILDIGLEGFIGTVNSNGKKLNNLLAGLTGQTVNYSLGGDFTLNVFNAGIADTGLLELHLGRGNPSMNLGTGGVDTSIGALVGAGMGLETWKVNAQLLLSSEDTVKKYGSQLRTLYSGDAVQRQEYADILKGKTIYSERRDVSYTESVYDKNTGIKTVYLGDTVLSDNSRFGLNLYFAHEAYRNGIVDDADSQKRETTRAVEGHISTALGLINAYGAGSLGENALAEAEVFTIAQQENSAELMELLLLNYDSSADYWKLVKSKYDYWEWIDDGSRDFDVTDLLESSDFFHRKDESKDKFFRAVITSRGRNKKSWGTISEDRMEFEIASCLGDLVIAQPRVDGVYTGKLYAYADLEDMSKLKRNLLIQDTMERARINAENSNRAFNLAPHILGEAANGFEYLVPTKLSTGSIENTIMNAAEFNRYYNERLVEEGWKQVGENYVWGGKDPAVHGGLDCSGFSRWAMLQVYGDSIRIRNANEQATDPNLTVPGDNSSGTLNFYNWRKDEDGNIVLTDSTYDHVTMNLPNNMEINPYGGDKNTRDNPATIILKKIPVIQSHQTMINRQINWHYIFFG